jgi:ankyrin repeat protein
MVINTGVDLNKHMGKGSWYLFISYDWPAGLALVLDHGANTEVQDAMGYTPIMRAAQAESWPTVEALLAHGARTDHAGNDGRTLRDLLSEAVAKHRDQVPPRIAALQASLR